MDKKMNSLGPDPSSLTTQYVLREVEMLKELLESKISGVEKAVDVAHQDLVRVPTNVQESVGGLKTLTFQKIEDTSKLVDEKFASIKKQLEQIESARVEQKKDTATAVDAALKAAKEAVSELNASNATAIAKSEAAFAKQIEQLGIQINTIVKSFDDKVVEIKERMADTHKTENINKGKSEGISMVGGVIMAIVGASGVIFGIVMAIIKQ